MRGVPRPDATGVLVGLALTVAALVEALWYTPSQVSGWLFVPTAALLGLPTMWRNVLPLTVLAVVLAVTVVQRLMLGVLWDSASSLVVTLVALFAVAARTPLPVSLSAYAGSVVVLSVADVSDDGGSDWPFIALVLGAIWLAGTVVRRQRDLTRRVADHAATLEQVQEARERAAAASERARIAREMHDVVAHCVSTTVVQAEMGAAFVRRDPARAEAAFLEVQRSGRQALDELRRMLGVLRAGEDASDVPAPSLRHLDPLIAGVRAAGMDVELTENGAQRPLPSSVDLAAYRVVQEALTNCLKHSTARRAEVHINYGSRHVEVAVSDDGGTTGVVVDSVTGTGRGLIGLRERAELLGGEVSAGIRSPRGFEVRARLPL